MRQCIRCLVDRPEKGFHKKLGVCWYCLEEERLDELDLNRQGKKTCTNCGKVQSFVAFAKNKATPTGRQAWCKICTRRRHAIKYKSKKESVAGAEEDY